MTMRSPVTRQRLAPLVFVLLAACAVGDGEGSVTSDRLFAEGCADGPLDLRPDFFATNPAENTQFIRLQRGEQLQETSDGLLVTVLDVARIRGDDGNGGLLGQPIEVRMPEGVAPPGGVVVPTDEAPLVSMTMYLNDSCHEQDISLQAIAGTITFSSLFNGSVNETKKSERLTEAVFTATFADPRTLSKESSDIVDQDPALLSEVSGDFSFYFRRGQPAQPFP